MQPSLVPHGDSREDEVGIVSGGRGVVEQYLVELRERGVDAWSRPMSYRDDGAMSRFDVFVSSADEERARAWAREGMSVDAMAASDADSAEHRNECRRARPWVEFWFDDGEPFEEQLRMRVTIEQARALKGHMEQGSTWRGLAAFARQHYSQTWLLDWSIPGHQAVGILLCEIAASALGEEAGQPPWV